MKFKRSCGILLHITSLPSSFGIGDLGTGAYCFVDFLHRSGQQFWQVLPLHPVGYGASPYDSFSAFAGNPDLIALDRLLDQGILCKEDLKDIPCFSVHRVELENVRVFKNRMLKKAFLCFAAGGTVALYEDFLKENMYWLEDYALFMALKEHFKGKPWYRWEAAAALRHQETLENYRRLLKNEIAFHKFVQFIFFTQWNDLRSYARSKGIKIIGDLPIFVSYDSSDVWTHPELFQLDDNGFPLFVAGVPPDYFSRMGQLWGNPLYRWKEMEKDDFRWWRERLSLLLRMVDIIRIDHFRGFEAYWAVPAGEKTAVNGKWVKGPGERFFSLMERYLGPLPAVAEDLGFITPEVKRLKERFNYPGMEILQFAFASGKGEMFLPGNYPETAVVYTGTHDNDTILGWYRMVWKKDCKTACLLRKYLGLEKRAGAEEICWRLIEFAYQTRSFLVIVPLQDVLCLGSEARMNYPGKAGKNWRWRFTQNVLTEEKEQKLAALAASYGRWG